MQGKFDEQKPMTIVVATKNQGKVREMINAFAELPVRLISLRDIAGDIEEPVEDGDSFEANSIIKASYYQQKTGYACLADDSGLEVAALGGRPGVYSARYSGENATDGDNNKKLQADIAAQGLTSSPADYQCALTFVDNNGCVLRAKGFCNGVIRNIAKGTGGFGYDPYFYVSTASGEKAMAELTLEEKGRISHRGNALRLMAKQLKEYLK